MIYIDFYYQYGIYFIKMILYNLPIFLRPNFIWNSLDSKTSYQNFNGIIRSIPVLPKNILVIEIIP